MPDLLKGGDELAAILGAIGTADGSKHAACQDAKAWCAVNTEHKGVCDRHPQVWKSLGERIFAIDVANTPHATRVLGEGLIYRTFRDDAHPQRAFERMCGATGLADVLAKRFVMFASKEYEAMLWDTWRDQRAELTGLGEAIEDMSAEETNKLADDYFPDMDKADKWESDAKDLFYSAPPNELYLDKYRNDPVFAKVVDVLFTSTSKSLFENRNITTLDSSERDEEPALGALYDIGELLGVYIVCLWQLERNLVTFEDKHAVDEDLMSEDDLEVALEEMRTEIQDLRVQLCYAQDLILDPKEAVEITNQDLWHTFQEELYEYEDTDAFDDDQEVSP